MSVWQQLPSDHQGLTNHSAVWYNKKVWVFGGESDHGINGKVFSYDPATNQWSLECQNGRISARIGHSAVFAWLPLKNFPYRQPIDFDALGDDVDHYDENGEPISFADVKKPEPKAWELMTPEEQKEQQGYAPCMVVFGGAGNRDVYDDLWAFDLGRRIWTQLDARGQWPSKVTKHNAVVIDSEARGQQENRMVVLGGWDQDRANDDVFELNLETLEWKRVQIPGLQPRIWSQSVVRPNDGIYVYAGEDRNIFLQNSLFRCDFDLKNWSVVDQGDLLPSDRYGHGLAYIRAPSDALLMWGGYGGEEKMYADLWAFSFSNRRWVSLGQDDLFGEGSLPEPRFGHSFTLIQGLQGEPGAAALQQQQHLPGEPAEETKPKILLFGGKLVEMSVLGEVQALEVEMPSSEEAWTNLFAASPVAEPWACGACTFENPGSSDECSMCGTQRPPQEPEELVPVHRPISLV